MVLETAVQTPQDVEAMQRLSAAGWGRRRIARELGCSPETVRKYLRQGGWQPYGKPCRNTVLDGQRDWLRQRFLAHRGNADVVRQELASEKGIEVSLRTVERAVEPWRRELRNAALATVRFETPPGPPLSGKLSPRSDPSTWGPNRRPCNRPMTPLCGKPSACG
jgi:transposase